MSGSSNKKEVFFVSLLFFIAFVLATYSFGGAPEIFLIDRPRNLYVDMNNLNLTVPWHLKIALDYVGFFIPLVTGMILLALSLKVRLHLSPHEKRLFLIYTELFIVGGSTSAVLPGILKASWTGFQKEGHLNPMPVVTECPYCAYIITPLNQENLLMQSHTL